MAINIALVTQKGGSGKTTIAACLAGYWKSKEKKTCLVDADPQQSATEWHKTGGRAIPIDVYTEPRTKYLTELVSELEEQDVVLIDTAGFQNQTAVEAAYLADIILIPVKPSPMDIRAVGETLGMLRKVGDVRLKEGREHAKIVFILNMVVPGTIIAKNAKDELSSMSGKVLRTEFRNRIAYPESFIGGTTPTFYEPRGAAAQEIEEAAQEIIEIAGETNG
ncbi:ParA family protein [Candidatus Igneacidithiobacillus taiwanensis]|uniref:ParA family protein n=1 Tax=Candidatus Igneacidithiobacillus taiwanensis TaxID=1945924 RepID=UPI00289FD87D|nr:ParA family protein [Candidatus Igneacidithiobacillus taiwanensis]